ncbi:unnamed protein product [Urochloa humidicola]
MASDDPPFPDATKGGYHVLRIDGYSRTLDINCGAPCFMSGPFRAGSHAWRIGYYPRGSLAGNQGFISLYLFLVDDSVAESVTIEFKFSMLDPYLKPLKHVNSSLAKPLMATFSAPGSSYGYERFISSKMLGQLRDLGKYDFFAVRVDVRIVKEEDPSTMLPSPDTHDHLGHVLYRNKEHADVEFRVGEETFAAHRLLLEARSPIFTAKLLGRNNKEHKTTTVVQINDMEPRVFEAMLSFIYTDSWPKMERKEEGAMSQRLFVAADQYGLQRLKLMCESRLCNLIDASSVAEILLLADKHQCAALKEACFDFIGSKAILLAAREKFLAAWKTNELWFNQFVSLCPTIIKDRIFNILENDWSSKSVEALHITLDIE